MTWSPNKAQLALMVYCQLSPAARDSDIGRKLLVAMQPPPELFPCTASQLPSARCKADEKQS